MRTSHKGAGMIPSAPWTRANTRLLPVDGLVHPPVVGRLLGRRSRMDRGHRAKHLRPPGIDRVAERASGHGIPLGAGHGPCVANQLPAEFLSGAVGQELGCLELLRHDRRFGLGPRARVVVGREREKDDETQQHRETGGQHAEDPRGTVTVAEIAALRRSSTHDKHRRNRDSGDHHDGGGGPDEIHAGASPLGSR
jgi:hypothetical protein